MEDKNYGNVYEIGLKDAYQNTSTWRNESYLFEGCKGCHYIDVCQSGCRMDAFAASGKMDGQDPLMPGKEFIVKPFKFKNSRITPHFRPELGPETKLFFRVRSSKAGVPKFQICYYSLRGLP